MSVVSLVRDGKDASWATWDLFWDIYPRRVARKEAERAWQRMTREDREAALEALVNWRRVWLARGELQFVPYPATWLNGERWTDEMPTVNTGPRPAAQAPAKLAVAGERSEMPESVRDAFARIRNGGK